MEIDATLEKNILGHLLWFGKTADSESIFSVLDRVELRWFADKKNQIIFEAIADSFASRGGKLDSISLLKHLSEKGKLELAGGTAYLSSLIAERSRSTDLPYLIETFSDSGKKKDLLKLFASVSESMQKNEATAAEAMGELEKVISSLRGYDSNTIVDIVKEAETVLQKANNAEKYGCYGYSWGIPGLDRITGGIETGKSYVVGATKKSGKTKFVINTIRELRRQNIPMLFLSMEMNGEAVVKELLSTFARLNNDTLKKPLSEMHDYAFRSVIPSMASGITVDTQSALNVMQIRHKITQAARQGVKVVFLDYLQKMDFQIRGSAMNYATVIATAVSQLADIARDNGIAFIFLSQLRNDAENQMADISFLKDSGGIAEGVDCIIVMNNIDRINKNYEKKTNEVWMNIEQRSGQSGFIKCHVDLGTALYQEIESVRQG